MSDIQLKTTSESSQAKKDLSDVVSAINEVKDAINSIGKANGLDKVKQSAKSAADEVKKTRPTFAEFKSAIKGMDFPLKNFGKSLLRIAKLRLLRGIIRSITGAFKEGLGNIYQYSAAMNNMDASHMKGSLDSVASSLQYMKNAVASAVAPLIAQLVPAIATVANWFVTAASAVAQFFAALGGATTYTRAKLEATEWGNVASGASGAAAAAQEYKNTILGFDEIHALNDVPSSGGGGGGGGGSTPDYSNMFEEAEVGQKIKDLVQLLKDNWQDILDIVEAIGVSLLAWRIASGVLDFFDGLGLGGKYAQGIAQLLTGIVITIMGVKLAYEGGYDIAYEGPDLMNIIKTAIGVALGGIGGAVAGHGLTVMTGVSGFTGAGAVIGFSIALVASIVGFKVGMDDKYFEDTVGVTQAYQSVMQVMENASLKTGTYSDAVAELKDRFDKLKSSTDAFASASDAAFAKTLVERIKELNSKTSLTTEEVAELRTKCELLNSLGLDGIKVEFNELTGEAYANWNEIDTCIEKTLELARTEAQFELLKDAYKTMNTAYSDANDYKQEGWIIQQKYNEAQAKFSAILAANGGEWDKTDEKQIAAKKSADDYKAALDQIVQNYKESKISGDEAKEMIEQLEYAMGIEKDTTEKASGAVQTNDKVLRDMGGTIRDATGNIITMGQETSKVNSLKPKFEGIASGISSSIINTAKDAKTKLNDAKSSTTSLDSLKPTFKGVKDGLGGINTNASNAGTNTWNLYNALNKLNGMKIAFTLTATTIANGVQTAASKIASDLERIKAARGYAEGGFIPGFANGGLIPSFASGGINSASLFMAHENGAPEMVGRIGNHTAVANTSQMVDAMAQGVYRAMSEVMGSGGNVEVNVTLDGQRIARAVDNANRVRNRRFNVQA